MAVSVSSPDRDAPDCRIRSDLSGDEAVPCESGPLTLTRPLFSKRTGRFSYPSKRTSRAMTDPLPLRQNEIREPDSFRSDAPVPGGGRVSPSRRRLEEGDAYIFVKRKHGGIGWCTKNPERNPDGQAYTRNECLSNPA